MFPVMKGKPYAARRVQDWTNLLVEPKLNGIRLITKLSGSAATFFTINGNVVEMFADLAKPLHGVMSALVRKHGKLMVDAEVLSADGKFETISGAIHRKNYQEVGAQLHVFFAMPWGTFRIGADNQPQYARLEELECKSDFSRGFGHVHRVPSTYITCDVMVTEAADAWHGEGYEGAMVKQVFTPYGGRRSYDWMKLKKEETSDLRVIAIKPGRGKYEGMVGAVIVKHRGVEVPVSGMTDEQRTAWWKKPSTIVGKMIEVRYQHATAKQSLRHPRFVRLRPDKD